MDDREKNTKFNEYNDDFKLKFNFIIISKPAEKRGAGWVGA